MKKQIFNLSIIGILLLTLFSCENLFSPKQDIPTNVIETPTLQTNVATVKISSKMPRTVLPEAFTEKTQGLTWKLTVSDVSETCYTEEWTDTEDGNTAYQNMLADSFTLATGTYKFSLSVDRVGNDGKRVLYSIIESQEIKLGTNVLNFEMKEATGDSAAPGSIDFTLNFPPNVVTNAIATLHKWNSSSNDFETQNPSDTNEFLASNTNQSFLSSVNYAKENIAAGTYLLKIQLQQFIASTQEYQSINTYSCIVRVAPGLCSKGKYTLNNLAQLFNLFFNLNGGKFESGSSTSMTYNANECIVLPKPTKEGYDFAGWYTDEALQTPVQLENDNKYRITQDITLYAKWEKNLSFNYSFILKDKDGSPVSTGASYSVDSDKFATIKVFNPNDSDEVWSYLIESNDENVSFTEGYNYTISVDLKATEQTVVGIAAAETDMFFTVGTEWKTYSFETGYLKANSQNGISIGTGLSKTVYVSNLVITETTDQSNLPILSFYISKEGITSYLQGNPNNDIIQVEKTTESTNNNSGYKLTLNSTGVSLQLRDYISNTGLSKASFNMNSSNQNLKTSIVAKTTNSEQFAKTWNTPTEIGTDTKTCNVFVPVYTANEEYIIDGILSEGQTAGDVIEISNYKIENITSLDNTGKVFAIKTDSTWNKSTTLPFTQQVTIQPRSDYVYDVLLMDSFATAPNDESDWNECIRFLNTSEDTDNFTFTFTSENNNTTYKIENQTEEELTLNITLTADCKVVIEKVESSVIDLTNAWLASQEESSAQGYYYSLPAGNYCVKEDLELKYPIQIAAGGGEVKLYANSNFKITCSTSFTADITKTYNAMIALPMSAGTLTLGGGTGNLTIDGSGISSLSYLVMSSSTFNLQDKCTITNGNVSYGAVYVGAGTFTMNDGGTITNCKATDGGAVYITGGGTFNMTGGTITGCSATNSGGGVWMNGGSLFTMSGYSKIENCTATNNEGGGVFVTDVNNPCTFKMLDNATITRCSAEKGGGGVSYGCGTRGTFEISGNAKILKNKNNNSSYGGGGIFLYGELTMTGGTISSNEAYNGAGVYVRHASSSFTMNGGTISDNKATVSGGGVYLWDPTSSFTMTNGTISNNLVNGTNNGASIQINDGTVYLPNPITITGDSFTENIIDGEKEVTNVTTELTNYWLASHVNSSDQWYYYSLPAGNYCVIEDITLNYPIVIEENGGNTQIYADGEYSITCQTSLPSDGTYTTMITLKSGNTLTLGGGTGYLTLDGNAVLNMTTLISVNGGSILNLQDNCTITNGNVIDGAVYIGSGCTFNMSGGTITENSNTNTAGYCAGVKVSGGTFTMTAGTISDNYLNNVNHGASIKINSGNVNLPNTDALTGGVFTYNIINGEVQYPSGGTTSTYSVGDVYPKDGTPIGVVFKTDTEYVYIIGLEEEQQQLCYGTRNCVTQIQRNEPTTNNFNNEFNGCQNMTNWYSFITTNSVDFSSAEFPAFNYCLTYRDTEGEGGTWYLPASQELSIIKSNIETLNSTLQSQNATPLATSYFYWSSTYTSAGQAYKVAMNNNGSQDENSLDTPCYVRPCKRIKIADGSSDVLIYGLDVDTACNAISNIYTEGEHYIKLDSSVTAEQLETIKDAIEKNNKLTFDDTDPDESSTIYLDLSSTEIIELPADSLSELDTLTSVILPTSLERMDGSVFQYCKYLNKFVVSADNRYFKVDDGGEILLSKDGTELISWPCAIDDIIIPSSVTKIADYALSMSYITSVDLNNVVEIGDFAFYYTDIEILTIPSSVTKIGKYAFYECKNLGEVDFAVSINWTVINDAGLTESVTVTDFDKNNLIYASDDDIPGYADYTWIKDSSSTSGGGIANYTDTDGISISNYQYPKTSLVTVNSQVTRIDCSYEVNGVFGLYWDGSVTLSPFAIGQYEVTQELYLAIMKKNPSTFTSSANITSGEIQELRPVETVSWYEAVAFCNELTEQTMGKSYCVYYTDESLLTVYTTDDASDKNLPYFDKSKKGYRLPTEAEWEFAARGGDTTQDDWTWEIPGNLGNSSDDYSNYAWFVDNSDTITHQVGKKTPNKLI